MSRRSLAVLVALASGAFVLGGARPATAAVAWGDASLVRDDARVEIAREGTATVTHVLSLRVSGKKFRAFVIDGVDDGAEPPDDPQSTLGRDGPGWPIEIEGEKGEKLLGLVEPTKETRKLRVRLGDGGLARGDWTVRLRYRVDLAKQHLFARDDASLHFSWQGPHWPDGFDAGKITFALPPGVTEPRIALADPAGGEQGAQAVEGVALVAVQRSPDRDVVEITRPHVAHGDDATWVVHVDPRAMPEVAAQLPRPERDTFRVADDARGLRAHLRWVLATPVLGLLLGGALWLRDRGARRAARLRGVEPRPLVRLEDPARAVGYGATFTGACVATIGGHLYVAASLLVAALALAAARPPLPPARPRARGRWLAIPTSAIPSPLRAQGSPLDPSSALGLFLVLVVVAGVGAGAVHIARTHVELAVVAVIHALALVPLFATGRVAQLPPDLARDAWPALRPAAGAIAAIPGVRVKPIARLTALRGGDSDASASGGAGVDEVRARIDVPEEAVAQGVLHLELGCAIVQGTGAATLVPELLIRLRDGSPAVELLGADRAAEGDATFARAPGRAVDEVVLSIRPAITAPAAMRRWVAWVLASVGTPAPAAARGERRSMLVAASL